MKSGLIPIKDDSHLKRDMTTGAVININDNKLKQHLRIKKRVAESKKKEQRIDELENTVSELKSQISELTILIKEVFNK